MVRKGLLLLGLLLFTLSGFCSDRVSVMSFIFSAADNAGKEICKEEGTVSYSGDRFRIELKDQMLVVSDGTAMWVYKEQSDDILILEAGFGSFDADNLESAIRKLVSVFGYTGTGDDRVDIKRDAKNRPAEVTFFSAGKSYYKVTIKSVAENVAADDKIFTFSLRDYPNAVVTDLR